MRKCKPNQKKFSEATGKLHRPCPHPEKTAIHIMVVIKGGHCYRSDECMVIECRYNKIQNDLERILSVTW